MFVWSINNMLYNILILILFDNLKYSCEVYIMFWKKGLVVIMKDFFLY